MMAKKMNDGPKYEWWQKIEWWPKSEWWQKIVNDGPKKWMMATTKNSHETFGLWFSWFCVKHEASWRFDLLDRSVEGESFTTTFRCDYGHWRCDRSSNQWTRCQIEVRTINYLDPLNKAWPRRGRVVDGGVNCVMEVSQNSKLQGDCRNSISKIWNEGVIRNSVSLPRSTLLIHLERWSN